MTQAQWGNWFRLVLLALALTRADIAVSAEPVLQVKGEIAFIQIPDAGRSESSTSSYRWEYTLEVRGREWCILTESHYYLPTLPDDLEVADSVDFAYYNGQECFVSCERHESFRRPGKLRAVSALAGW